MRSTDHGSPGGGPHHYSDAEMHNEDVSHESSDINIRTIIGYGSPNRARLRVQCAVPIDNRGPVDPSSEYYAYKVNLQRSKSAGTGSCAGCSTPACIVLNSIQLFQPPDANNDPELTNPANRNYVTWQSAVVPGCPLSTPTQSKSWGQVKSLYR